MTRAARCLHIFRARKLACKYFRGRKVTPKYFHGWKLVSKYFRGRRLAFKYLRVKREFFESNGNSSSQTGILRVKQKVFESNGNYSSQTDILRISFGNTFGVEQEGGDEAIFDMLSINQVMKHSPVTVSSESTIKEAGEILADKEFQALPVTDNDKLVGIITTTDLIKYFLSQY